MQSVELKFLNVNSQLWFEVVKCGIMPHHIGGQFGIDLREDEDGDKSYTVVDGDGYPVSQQWYKINWALYEALIDAHRLNSHLLKRLTPNPFTQAALIHDGTLIGFVYTTASNGTKVSYGGSKIDNGSIVEVGRATISRAAKYLSQSGGWWDAPALYINNPDNGSFEGVQ